MVLAAITQEMVDTVLQALAAICAPSVLLTILLSAIYGIFVGAIPGLTATMAVALMVPLTFFLSDVQAVAAIVTTVTCSIFAGDIPAALLRIPGTPASAAYAADAYALTQQGRHRQALGVSLTFSILGGLFGTAALVLLAPQLAQFAKSFTSYEYFWLYVLGLTCAAIVSDESRLKGLFALLLGLLFSCVGLGTDYSVPRLTFGFDQLITGIEFIPAMIGLFGLSEVLRGVISLPLKEGPVEGVKAHGWPPVGTQRRNSVETGSVDGDAKALVNEADITPLQLALQRKVPLVRSSMIGATVGMLPGAGADIAAWIAYAVSKRFSRHPGQYGKGSLEGIGDASGANNAALGGAWIPALVFGIPGDSVTAIAIGVLLMKNITPGPQIFDPTIDPAQTRLVYVIFLAFLLANLVLIPVGALGIRAGSLLIRVPRRILLPIIVLFCVVGSYSLSGNYFDVWVMLGMGLLGFVLESWGVPLAPIVLGLILGGPLEHKFIQCITKDPSPGAFLSSGISIVLAIGCLLMWLGPALGRAMRSGKS